MRRWLGRRKRLGSLDDYARHYYGENFAALTEQQLSSEAQAAQAGEEEAAARLALAWPPH